MATGKFCESEVESPRIYDKAEQGYEGRRPPLPQFVVRALSQPIASEEWTMTRLQPSVRKAQADFTTATRASLCKPQAALQSVA